MDDMETVQEEGPVPVNTDDWIFWKIFVLAVAKKSMGRHGVMDDRCLAMWKRQLRTKMSDNFDDMTRSRRNRDAQGNFCLRHAQDNMLGSLSGGQLKNLETFITNLQNVVAQQRMALRSMSRRTTAPLPKKVDDKNKGAPAPTTSVERCGAISREDDWIFWKVFVLSVAKKSLGKDGAMTNDGLHLWKGTLANQMDDNYEDMVRSPRNKDAEGNFCLQYAQANMLTTLNGRQLDNLDRFISNFEAVLGQQKSAIQSMNVAKLTRSKL